MPCMLIGGDTELGTTEQVEAKGIQVGDLRLVVTRLTGDSHLKKREPCDDYWAVASNDRGTAVVVADGAGSAQFSRLGAQIISQELCRHLLETDHWARLASAGDDEAASAAIRATISAAVESACSRIRGDHPELAPVEALRHYAATVIGCLVCADRAFSFHLGDGFSAFLATGLAKSEAAGGLDTAASTKFVSRPENGAFANETFFFTQADWSDHLRVDIVRGAGTIVLMTDGLTPFACTQGYVALDPGFWNPVLRYLGEKGEVETARALAKVLDSERVRDLSDDDKTVVIVHRVGGEERTRGSE